MLTEVHNIPETFTTLEKRSVDLGFTMPSDTYVGSLLKTLVASKPGGRFLELGTGMGLSLSWMIEGTATLGTLISLDNDDILIKEVQKELGEVSNLTLVSQDGESWIENYEGDSFDLIFADSWPGKFNHLDETIALLKVGGFYVIDDLTPSSDWPEGHSEKVVALITHLRERKDLTVTSLDWSTGIIVATRI